MHIRGSARSPVTRLPADALLVRARLNISTDIKIAYHDKMREVLGNDPKMREPNAVQPACIEAMRAVAAQKFELFGAAGKGSLY
jgi:fructose-bisphosphate aldolase class II